MDLESVWMSLMERIGLSENKSLAEKWWETLESLYCESTRAYHTLNHLSEMFDFLGGYVLKNRDIVEMATFFHDSIYFPKSSKNEEESAELFRVFAAECISSCKNDDKRKGLVQLRDAGVHYILETKSHRIDGETEGDTDLKAFLDADMAIIGASTERYMEYCSQIRQEFSFVEGDAFKEGRTKFLRSTAGNREIYYTEYAKQKCEARARENMAWELEQLSK